MPARTAPSAARVEQARAHAHAVRASAAERCDGTTGSQFNLHVAAHLAHEPELRPDAGRPWAMRASVEDLNELHQRAHTGRCVHCAADVISYHSDADIHPVWLHDATGAQACDGIDGASARPDRLPTAYATITVTMRVRLPGELGADPHPDEVETWFDDNHVRYFVDDQDGGTDPSDVVAETTIVTDISARPTVP